MKNNHYIVRQVVSVQLFEAVTTNEAAVAAHLAVGSKEGRTLTPKGEAPDTQKTHFGGLFACAWGFAFFVAPTQAFNEGFS